MINVKRLFECVTLLLCSSMLISCSLVPESNQLTDKLKEANFRQVDSDDEEIQNYRAQVTELLAMKDDVNRLVALEADLSYLLNEIGRIEEASPSFAFEQGQDIQNLNEEQMIFSAESNVVNPANKPSSILSNDIPVDVSKFQEAGTIGPLAPEDIIVRQATPISKSLTTQVSTLRQVNETTSNSTKFRDITSTGAKKDDVNILHITKIQSECNSQHKDASSEYGIHLASYSTVERAKKGWKEIKEKFGQLICSELAKVQKVTVNDKIYYSLRIGGFRSTSEATETCAVLRDKKQYCASAVFSGEQL